MPVEIKSDLIKNETIALLNKFQILRRLSKDQIRKLLGEKGSGYSERIAKLVRYKSNEIVIKQGDFDSWIFWVVKGAYSVVKNDVTITVFDVPGEVFGEMSILEEDCRSASVIAVSNGVCLSIDLSVFDTIDDDYIKEKISKGIHRLKSERLNLTTDKLVAEKRKLAEQVKKMKVEIKRLEGKEKELNARDKMLLDKEKKLVAWEKEFCEKIGIP